MSGGVDYGGSQKKLRSAEQQPTSVLGQPREHKTVLSRSFPPAQCATHPHCTGPSPSGSRVPSTSACAHTCIHLYACSLAGWARGINGACRILQSRTQDWPGTTHMRTPFPQRLRRLSGGSSRLSDETMDACHILRFKLQGSL